MPGKKADRERRPRPPDKRSRAAEPDTSRQTCASATRARQTDTAAAPVDPTQGASAEEQVRALHELAVKSSEAAAMADVLPLCLSTGMRISGMDCGGVYLVNRQTGDLELTVHHGLSPGYVQEVKLIPAGTVSANLILSGSILFNVIEEGDESVAQLLHREGLTLAITVPFRYQDRVVACVSLGSHTLVNPPQFARKALEALAAQTGNAIARVQAEDDLRSSETKLRLLVEASEDVILMQDLDGKYLFYNAPNRYGISSEDVIGRYPRDLFDSSVADELFSNVKRVVESGQTVPHEETLAWRGLDESFLSISYPIHSPDGQMTAVATVSRNVTDRKRAEQLIRVQRDFALELAACASTEAALPLCLDMMLAIPGIDCGGIYLLDEKGDEFILGCCRGLSEPFVTAVSRGTTSSGWGQVAMSGTPWYSRVADLDPSLNKGVEEEGLCSVVTVPLNYVGRVIGCVSLASRTVPEIVEIHKNTIELLATQLGNTVGRIRSREALFESEETTRSLLDAFPECAALLDNAGRVLSANEAMVTRLGTTMSAITGTIIFDLLPPDVASARRAVLYEVLRTGESVVFEDVNNDRMIRSVVYPVKDRCGQITRFAIYARDITDERQAQARLRESEETARALVDAIPHVATLVDRSGKLLAANQMFADRVRKSSSELLGTCVFDWFPPQVAASRKAHLDRAITSAQPHEFEDEREGRIFHSHAHPILDPEGHVTRVAVLARDITEQKRSEKVASVFARLGQDLAAAHTYAEIGEILREHTEELWSWDSFYFSVRKSGPACFDTMLLIDTIDGVKTSFKPVAPGRDFSGRSALMDGESLLINRENGSSTPQLHAFGNVTRPSASMIHVPIRTRERIAGIVSIQSYEPGHFNEPARELMLRIADVVGPSLERCRFERQSQAFEALGKRLNAVQSPVEAARTAVETADELLGWDCCFLDFYVPEDDAVTTLLIVDTIDGKRRENVPQASLDPQPTGMMRQVIAEGPKVILRSAPSQDHELIPFGTNRRSASLMFVPVRSSTGVIGMLSIQSYTENAYAEEDLDVLQALADHCAGALERTRVEFEHARLATAVEAAAESMIIADTDWRILYVNPAFEGVTGYTSAEVIGRRLREVLGSGHHDDSFYDLIDDTVSQGRIWSGHIVTRRKNGDLLEEDVTIAPMWDSMGVISSYVAVRRDLTREMYMEKELLHAHKLEVVGRLVSGIAHDFNNILHVTMGCSQVLLRQLPAAGPGREQLDSIIRAAKRGANITRQLLAFSHKQVLRPRLLNLNSVVANVQIMIGQLVGSQIDLVIRLDPLLGIVNADPGQMELVIMNLATNARDAMQEGGTLTVATTNVSIDNTSSAFRHSKVEAGNYVMLMVSDTGHGMDAATRARIFEPFFTTKEPGKGTGLGLSTVHGIVTQSGGSIGVSSVLGKGTAFKIYLPRVEEASTDLRAPLSVAASSAGETILLVEDEDEVRRLAVAALQSFGYKALAVPGGAAALEAVAGYTDTIHLVLTDILMPGMDGWELVRRLRVLRPGMKAIYMSGYLDNRLVADVINSGNATFIQKPFDTDLLAVKIRQVLDSGT